ncbi:hypothetical protein ACOMHN_023125 [Nucella lapillus]
MAHAGVLFLGLLISGLLGAEGAPSGGEHASCQMWDGLARQLSTSTGAQQVCTSSGSPCTRIDCSGAYQYNAGNVGSLFSLPGGSSLELDYCFGVILNHCSANISLDFYLQVPDKHVNQTTRIYHNTLLNIPGLSYSSNSSGGISARGYLYFQMERHASSVTFSVTVKVRMRFAGLTYWPDELQRRVIRNETVPVPPCPPGAHDNDSVPRMAQCTPPHWKQGQGATTPPSLPPPPHTGSGRNLPADLGKPCNETKHCWRYSSLACDVQSGLCVCSPDFEQVPFNRTGIMCRPKIRHGKPCRSQDDCILAMSERCHQGACQCHEDSLFDNDTQTCQPRNTGRGGWTPPPTVLPHMVTEPTHSKKQDSSSSKAPMIAGAVVGGLVVLGGILLVAYFAIRRLRRPYHHRQLLLEGEDSDGIM